MSSPLSFEVLTLFPQAVEQFVQAGLLGKAIGRGLVEVHCTNIREFAADKYRTVDDTPFGGGAGMVMKPEPVVAALEHVQSLRGPAHRVLLTPSAPRFTQRMAERLSQENRIVLLCGRYEGIDDRVREHFVDECISLGDFVLNGGEVAALAVIEAVARLREGVLGNLESAAHESFALADRGAVLECPQYTKPAVFRDMPVPSLLQSGNHDAIAKWRQRIALSRTWQLRPDLRPQSKLESCVALYGMGSSAAESAAQDLKERGGEPAVRVYDFPVEREENAQLAECKTFARASEALKFLRKKHGVKPWIVAVDEREHPEPLDLAQSALWAATSPEMLADGYGEFAEQGAALVLLSAEECRQLSLEPDALWLTHANLKDAGEPWQNGASSIPTKTQFAKQKLQAWAKRLS